MEGVKWLRGVMVCRKGERCDRAGKSVMERGGAMKRGQKYGSIWKQGYETTAMETWLVIERL